MGNYLSREQQLVSEITKMFEKYFKQTSVTKKNFISLNRKFKELKKSNKEKWGKMANKSNAIMRNSIGLNPTKTLIKFKEFYKQFKQKSY